MTRVQQLGTNLNLSSKGDVNDRSSIGLVNSMESNPDPWFYMGIVHKA
jgi:hypothetical protein